MTAIAVIVAVQTRAIGRMSAVHQTGAVAIEMRVARSLAMIGAGVETKAEIAAAIVAAIGMVTIGAVIIGAALIDAAMGIAMNGVAANTSMAVTVILPARTSRRITATINMAQTPMTTATTMVCSRAPTTRGAANLTIQSARISSSMQAADSYRSSDIRIRTARLIAMASYAVTKRDFRTTSGIFSADNFIDSNCSIGKNFRR